MFLMLRLKKLVIRQQADLTIKSCNLKNTVTPSWPEIESRLMNGHLYIYTFADVNCRLKVVNTENGEEAFFDNLVEVDLFLSQT